MVVRVTCVGNGSSSDIGWKAGRAIRRVRARCGSYFRLNTVSGRVSAVVDWMAFWALGRYVVPARSSVFRVGRDLSPFCRLSVVMPELGVWRSSY